MDFGILVRRLGIPQEHLPLSQHECAELDAATPLAETLAELWAKQLSAGEEVWDSRATRSQSADLRILIERDGTVARLLRGRALGSALGSETANASRLQLCSTDLIIACDWSALCEQFESLTSGDKTVWAAALSPMPKNFEDYLERERPVDVRTARQLQATWATVAKLPYRSTARAGSPYQPDMSTPIALRLALLRAIGRKAWLRSLDTLPHPALVEHALFLRGVFEDPVELEACLGAAPSSTFISSAQPGSSLPTTLLDCCAKLTDKVAHCCRLPSRLDNLGLNEDMLNSSLKNWWDRLLTTVAGRPDALELLTSYCAQVTRRTFQQPPQHNASVDDLIFDRCSRRLAKLGANLEGFRAAAKGWVKPREDYDACDLDEPWQSAELSYWIVAAGAEFDRAGLHNLEAPLSAQVAQSLWDWLRTIWKARAQAIAMGDPGARVPIRLGIFGGAVLASLPGATEHWVVEWASEEDNRYAGLRRAHRREWNVSQALLEIAMHALRFMLEPAFQDDAADRLANEITRRAIYAWLRNRQREGEARSSNEPVRTWFKILGQLAATGEAQQTVVQVQAETLLPYFSHDCPEMAFAAQQLAKGLPADAVRQLSE